ncbi:MAG: hypothetical protein JOY86_06490 [Candidatus Eremiobacteraeota bacterium]|nr:hypothetical protein [Candidatus Eremiobacteraeota bacterium]
MFTGIGIVLFIGGSILQRAGNAEVDGEEISPTVMAIGEVCGWGGFICGLSLAIGAPSILAILAAVSALAAARTPGQLSVGFWTLSAGLALAAINQWPGLGMEWLTTVAIVAMLLGISAIAASWLKPVAQSA